jgi:hypothetical protein
MEEISKVGSATSSGSTGAGSSIQADLEDALSKITSGSSANQSQGAQASKAAAPKVEEPKDQVELSPTALKSQELNQ